MWKCFCTGRTYSQFGKRYLELVDNCKPGRAILHAIFGSVCLTITFQTNQSFCLFFQINWPACRPRFLVYKKNLPEYHLQINN